jgi:hypothetical protein
MAHVAQSTTAPLKNAYASGDIGRAYRGDDHRDNRRPSDQGRMGP